MNSHAADRLSPALTRYRLLTAGILEEARRIMRRLRDGYWDCSHTHRVPRCTANPRSSHTAPAWLNYRLNATLLGGDV